MKADWRISHRTFYDLVKIIIINRRPSVYVGRHGPRAKASPKAESLGRAWWPTRLERIARSYSGRCAKSTRVQALWRETARPAGRRSERMVIEATVAASPTNAKVHPKRSTLRSPAGFNAACSSMLSERAPTPPRFIGQSTWMSRIEFKPKRLGKPEGRVRHNKQKRAADALHGRSAEPRRLHDTR